MSAAEEAGSLGPVLSAVDAEVARVRAALDYLLDAPIELLRIASADVEAELAKAKARRARLTMLRDALSPDDGSDETSGGAT